MKPTLRRLLPLAVALLLVLSLTSCVDLFHKAREYDDAFHSLADQVIADDYDATYAHFDPATVPEADFRVFWEEFSALADGASDVTVESRGWNWNSVNGVTAVTGSYILTYDNGNTVLVTVIVNEENGLFSACNYRDITDFVRTTDKILAVTRFVTPVVTLAVIAFVIWMIVDCARRKMNKVSGKVLWMLLIILGGLSLSLTIGDSNISGSFFIGLFLVPSEITRDIASLSMTAKLILPVGAIVYFFLRKKLTKKPLPPVENSAEEAAEEAADEAYTIEEPAADAPAEVTEEPTPTEPDAGEESIETE